MRKNRTKCTMKSAVQTVNNKEKRTQQTLIIDTKEG